MNIRHSTNTRTSPPDQFLACCSCQPVGLSLLLYSSRRHLLLLPAMAIPSPTWPSLASKNFWLALTVAKLSCRLFIQPPDSSVWRWWAARTATSSGLARASVEISYLVLVSWSENELSNSLQLNQPRVSWLL